MIFAPLEPASAGCDRTGLQCADGGQGMVPKSERTSHASQALWLPEAPLTMKYAFYLSLLLAIGAAPQSPAQAPAFDHIVVVIEENHSFSDIIGNSAAPNINALAASGASIVNGATDPQG